MIREGAGERSAGSLFYVNGSHAEAVNDRWAFKLSAGYLTQDPLPRPTGTIPNAFNTPYPHVRQRGHLAAEVRRPRRLRRRRRRDA